MRTKKTSGGRISKKKNSVEEDKHHTVIHGLRSSWIKRTKIIPVTTLLKWLLLEEKDVSGKSQQELMEMAIRLTAEEKIKTCSELELISLASF